MQPRNQIEVANKVSKNALSTPNASDLIKITLIRSDPLKYIVFNCVQGLQVISH